MVLILEQLETLLAMQLELMVDINYSIDYNSSLFRTKDSTGNYISSSIYVSSPVESFLHLRINKHAKDNRLYT